MWIAAAYGNLEIVKCLVEAGADIYCSHLLHVAAFHGHLDVVKYLVEDCGLRVDVVTQGGTPLSWAFENYNIGVVKYLMTREECRYEFPDYD